MLAVGIVGCYCCWLCVGDMFAMGCLLLFGGDLLACDAGDC